MHSTRFECKRVASTSAVEFGHQTDSARVGSARLAENKTRQQHDLWRFASGCRWQPLAPLTRLASERLCSTRQHPKSAVNLARKWIGRVGNKLPFDCSTARLSDYSAIQLFSHSAIRLFTCLQSARLLSLLVSPGCCCCCCCCY